MTDPVEFAEQKAVLLFKIVEDLGVGCGYERSFKMHAERLLANRFLLGIDRKDLPLKKLLEIGRKMEMPGDFLHPLEEHFAEASLVFLGFEDNEPGCIYKIYLEFWDKVKEGLRAEPRRKHPALLHLGFKWRADDNTTGTR